MFPGQGSQHDDMRGGVLRNAPDLLAAVARELGCDPFDRLEEGTLYVQPAVFCASVASWRGLGGEPRPVAIAGHSLGELAALVAAEAISDEDGVRLVLARARACDTATRLSDGGMIALGVGNRTGHEIAGCCGAHFAADNSPRQTVLSGTHESLCLVERVARESGLRHKRLAISGPFHSSLMRPALQPFAAELDVTRVSLPSCPVFTGMTAAPFVDVRRQLLEGLMRPVRWRELLLALYDEGITRFVEAAPGKVLCGLVRRTLSGASTARLESSGVLRGVRHAPGSASR